MRLTTASLDAWNLQAQDGLVVIGPIVYGEVHCVIFCLLFRGEHAQIRQVDTQHDKTRTPRRIVTTAAEAECPSSCGKRVVLQTTKVY